ncbi:MAG: hypothetical protein HY290_08045 [Planctomycetia bacterium]|nr:hypothetical protein [Planctomycetia bacterium]
MSAATRDRRRSLIAAGCVCAMCLAAAGCGDALVNSGVAHPVSDQSQRQESTPPAISPVPASQVTAESTVSETADPATPATLVPAVEPSPAKVDAADASAGTTPPKDDPAHPRTFAVEGPGGAQRIGFDDLDLMKLIKMDPVTSDCIEKMPAWLRELSGKPVRIRGYMKPSGITEGIPQFVFVRSTELCCFGPKGKVYHLIAVTLKEGTTTDYIELKPFDVAGKFRIEKVELDEGLVYLLYHIDDAVIFRK